jgi:TPR repeat protein
MGKTNIVYFARRDEITDALMDSLKTGAQQLIALAVEVDIVSYLAQCVLGDMYEYGEGVPQSNAEADKWYRAAALQG